MSLLTETGEPLLMESGQPFITENTPDLPSLRASATLALIAHAFAPKGLGAKLVVIKDKLTSAVLQQYLQVWVHATPPRLRLALQIDDDAPTEPPFTRENPDSPGPAVYRINAAELPQDGFTHYLTVSAWNESNGIRSASASTTFKGKLSAPPVPLPEWVRPRLIRQNSTELPDLVEIHWRANTAVVVVAQLRKDANTLIRLGIADRDETRLLAEGIGVRFPYPDNQLYPVYFGIAGIRSGRESPIRWFDTPLMIRASDGQPEKIVITPDTLTGTARTLTGAINAPSQPSDFSAEIHDAVLATLGSLPANGNALIDHAIDQMFLKIKDVVRQGGSVTLDHLGMFSASWTNDRTTRDKVTGAQTISPGNRQPAFTASPGYKAGTKAGQIMTDEEAKAP